MTDSTLLGPCLDPADARDFVDLLAAVFCPKEQGKSAPTTAGEE